MKTLKFMFIVVFAFGMFNPFQSMSQAEVSKKTDITVTLSKNGEPVAKFTDGTGVEILTSSGNFLNSIKFKVPKGHEIMKFDGPCLILGVAAWVDFNENGIKDIGEVLVDSRAVLTKSGNLKFNFHKNGAGTYSPLGW